MAALLNKSPEEALEEVRLEPGPAGQAAYVAGEVYRAAGRRIEAVQSLETALQHDPGSPLARAELVFLTSRGEARVGSLRDLSAQWPLLERPRFYLGVAFVLVRRYAEAVEVLRRAVEDVPEDMQAWANLGHSLQKLGDAQAAREAAQQVRRLAGSFPWKRLACQQLFRAGAFSQAYAASSEARRQFPSLRADLLPWTLPLQVYGFVADYLVVFFWLFGIVLATSHEAAIGILAVALILTLWHMLATYSSGRRRRFLEAYRYWRWQRAHEVPAVA